MTEIEKLIAGMERAVEQDEHPAIKMWKGLADTCVAAAGELEPDETMLLLAAYLGNVIGKAYGSPAHIRTALAVIVEQIGDSAGKAYLKSQRGK